MEHDPPFQFSLWHLMAAITVFAVLLGLFHPLEAILLSLFGITLVCTWSEGRRGPALIAGAMVLLVFVHRHAFGGRDDDHIFFLAFAYVAIEAICSSVRMVHRLSSAKADSPRTRHATTSKSHEPK
jgi:hypothetical protein